MITLGIDLSSQPKDTAACKIGWPDNGNAWVVETPKIPSDDDALDKLIAQANVVGIDAPFGWPSAFVAAVPGWTGIHWTEAVRLSVSFRVTDLAIYRAMDRWPLSVSTNFIALPAMRAMALLARHEVTDKSGKLDAADGRRYVEVYPRASLKKWGLPYEGYKRISKAACQRRVVTPLDRRKEILDKIRFQLRGVNIPSEYADTDHALDALIASFTARAAALGRTIGPESAEQAAEASEGWIHLPRCVNLAERVARLA